jgi:hypothetical protein
VKLLEEIFSRTRNFGFLRFFSKIAFFQNQINTVNNIASNGLMSKISKFDEVVYLKRN